MDNPLLHIERTVVVSLLESEKYDLPYKDIDEKVFYHPFHRWMAKQIKKAKSEGIALDLLRALVEEKLDGSKWEQPYLELIATQPMYAWEQYYKHLRAKKIARDAARLFNGGA